MFDLRIHSYVGVRIHGLWDDPKKSQSIVLREKVTGFFPFELLIAEHNMLRRIVCDVVFNFCCNCIQYYPFV